MIVFSFLFDYLGRRQIVLQNPVKTKGRIVEIEIDGDAQLAIIEYLDVYGTRHKYEGTHGFARTSEVGDSVPITYALHDPKISFEDEELINNIFADIIMFISDSFLLLGWGSTIYFYYKVKTGTASKKLLSKLHGVYDVDYLQLGTEILVSGGVIVGFLIFDIIYLVGFIDFKNRERIIRQDPISTEATVVETISSTQFVFGEKRKATVEYNDEKGNIYRWQAKHGKYFSLRAGQKVSIIYARHNPKKAMYQDEIKHVFLPNIGKLLFGTVLSWFVCGGYWYDTRILPNKRNHNQKRRFKIKK